MADENKPLPETGAGSFVEAEVDKLRQVHEQILTVIMEKNQETKLALQKKDADIQILLKEKQEIRERLENEVAQLKAGIGRRTLGGKGEAEPDNKQPRQKIWKEIEDGGPPPIENQTTDRTGDRATSEIIGAAAEGKGTRARAANSR